MTADSFDRFKDLAKRLDEKTKTARIAAEVAGQALLPLGVPLAQTQLAPPIAPAEYNRQVVIDQAEDFADFKLRELERENGRLGLPPVSKSPGQDRTVPPRTDRSADRVRSARQPRNHRSDR